MDKMAGIRFDLGINRIFKPLKKMQLLTAERSRIPSP